MMRIRQGAERVLWIVYHMDGSRLWPTYPAIHHRLKWVKPSINDRSVRAFIAQAVQRGWLTRGEPVDGGGGGRFGQVELTAAGRRHAATLRSLGWTA